MPARKDKGARSALARHRRSGAGRRHAWSFRGRRTTLRFSFFFRRAQQDASVCLQPSVLSAILLLPPASWRPSSWKGSSPSPLPLLHRRPFRLAAPSCPPLLHHHHHPPHPPPPSPAAPGTSPGPPKPLQFHHAQPTAAATTPALPPPAPTAPLQQATPRPALGRLVAGTRAPAARCTARGLGQGEWRLARAVTAGARARSLGRCRRRRLLLLRPTTPTKTTPAARSRLPGTTPFPGRAAVAAAAGRSWGCFGYRHRPRRRLRAHCPASCRQRRRCCCRHHRHHHHCCCCSPLAARRRRPGATLGRTRSPRTWPPG